MWFACRSKDCSEKFIHFPALLQKCAPLESSSRSSRFPTNAPLLLAFSVFCFLPHTPIRWLRPFTEIKTAVHLALFRRGKYRASPFFTRKNTHRAQHKRKLWSRLKEQFDRKARSLEEKQNPTNNNPVPLNSLHPSNSQPAEKLNLIVKRLQN